jgi:ribosome biogenesis GTPase
MLGSSGVGKSSLVNRLAGRELMPVAGLRNDGRGRHTTRHRQLHALRNGALLVDTPGLRELQLWEGDLDRAFADIGELAGQCRFHDCAHRTEPGCAIRAALEDGSLDEERWASYGKLQRELARLSGRRGSREHAELKRRWRERARETKQLKRHGKLRER